MELTGIPAAGIPGRQSWPICPRWQALTTCTWNSSQERG